MKLLIDLLLKKSGLWFSSLNDRPRLKQVLILYVANLAGIPLGIGTSIFITRFLGTKEYGNYTFLNNIFNTAVIIFTFGFFYAGNRALVLNNDKRKAKEYYGAELVVLIVLFVIMSGFLFGYAYLDKNLADKGLDKFFLILIPFGWIFLLIQYFETLFQADNKIGELASSRLITRVGFFISAAVINLYFFAYTGKKLRLVWLFYLESYLVTFACILKRIEPKFTNLNLRVKELIGYNKTYGIHVYTGSLFAVGLASLTGVLISYFSTDNSGVGFYSLAVTFTSPLLLIPNVIATTHFKDFSTRNEMPGKLVKITVGLSCAAIVLLWVLVGPFIRKYYGVGFYPVIRLNFIMSIGIMLHGFADFYNRFLGAHGKGKELRNASIVLGIWLLTLNIILIPRFGATGAACTHILSGTMYLALVYYYYSKLKHELSKMEEHSS